MTLESWSTTMGERYVINDFSTEPWTATALDPTVAAEGHPDHRESCPYQQ